MGGWSCNIYLHIYKVFECKNMLWMGIWVHPYTVIHVQVGAKFWKIGVRQSPNDGPSLLIVVAGKIDKLDE